MGSRVLRRRHRVGRSTLKLLAALSALVTIWSFLDGRSHEPTVAPAAPPAVAPEPPPPIVHGAVEALADPSSSEIAIPDGIVLSPGESWSVTGAEANPRRSTHRIWLNDGGDEVRLLDRSGRLVDSCGWPPKESSATCRKSWR